MKLNRRLLLGSMLSTVMTAVAVAGLRMHGSIPPPPVVSFSTTSVSNLEGNSGSTPFVYVVGRAGNTFGTSTVSWAVTGSGANPASPSDFVGGVYPSGSLTFGPAVTSASITINVQGDGTVELNETFTVTLSSPVNASISVATALGTIINDDIPPPGSFFIGANETKALDLSTYLVTIDDSNDITLSVVGPTAGVLFAQVWNGLSPTAGESSLQVRRELADAFTVKSVGATNGNQIGTVSISGFSGPNSTGSLLTYSIPIVCDTSPPATWAMGAKTFAGYGGYPIMTYLPGNPADWTIQSQTSAGQFSIRADPTNVQYRLVLAGPINDAAQPGVPTVAPVAAAVKTVVLANAVLGTTFSLVVTFVANQFDCAPWPATDNPESGTVGNQLIRSMRTTIAYGTTYMLENGNYDINGTSLASYDIGFTWGFGTSPIGTGTGVPSSPYAGGAWDYSPNPTINSNFWQIASRNPWAANVNTLAITLTNVSGRTTNPVLGMRLTNVQVTDVRYSGLSGAGGGSAMLICVDHCIQTGSVNLSFDINSAGYFYLHNFSIGATIMSGLDCQSVFNRFSTAVSWIDTMNYLSEPFNTPTSACCLFNLHINRQGRDDPLHEDQCSSQQSVGWYTGITGHRIGPVYIGNVMWPGAVRLSSGHQANSGQCFFLSDHPSNVFIYFVVCGNALIGQTGHGITIDQVGLGTTCNYNMLGFDFTQTNPMAGYDPYGPEMRFGNMEDGGTGQTKYKWGIQGFPTVWSNNAGDSSGTIFNCLQTWQTTNLVNPLAGASAQDMGSVVRALSFKPGLVQQAGCFWDKSLVDHQRGTYDLTRLTA